jgi:hypothetical protein
VVVQVELELAELTAEQVGVRGRIDGEPGWRRFVLIPDRRLHVFALVAVALQVLEIGPEGRMNVDAREEVTVAAAAET